MFQLTPALVFATKQQTLLRTLLSLSLDQKSLQSVELLLLGFYTIIIMPLLPPPWFLRSLPGLGLALTGAYVGYKLVQHLQKQHTSDSKQLEHEETSAFLQHVDRAQLCSWLGLNSDALDFVSDEELPPLVEALSYVPARVRVSLIEVYVCKLEAGPEFAEWIRILESLANNHHHSVANNNTTALSFEQDKGDLEKEDSSSSSDPENHRDQAEQAAKVQEDHAPEKNDDEDDESSLAAERCVVLLTQINNDGQLKAFRQALQGVEHFFLDCLYVLWNQNHLEAVLNFIRRECYPDDRATFAVVEGLMRVASSDCVEHNMGGSSSVASVNPEALQLFGDLLQQLWKDLHAEHVRGLLQACRLTASPQHFLQKVASLPRERLHPLLICCARFENAAVLELLENLMEEPQHQSTKDELSLLSEEECTDPEDEFEFDMQNELIVLGPSHGDERGD